MHRVPAAAKIAGTFAFVVMVVLTPARSVGALLVDAAVVVGVVALARLPWRLVLRRLRIEVPFLAFALFLPLVADDGGWAAWNILAKGTIAVLAAIVLSSTTPVTDLLVGLERLRVPRVLVAIAGFMVRYLDVIVDEAQRVRVARLSRGDDPRWLWQARGVAAGAGTLFVRSYERGERVHLAMLARGYDGAMPDLGGGEGGGWVAAVPALVALGALVLA